MEQLIATGLTKTYRRRQVVKSISLSIHQGQVVGLLGPNGAGKSTTFQMIVGLVKPDSGSIMLGNKNLTKSSIFERGQLGIGYLPQEPSIFRRLNVENNLRAVLQLRMKNGPELEKKLDALLSELNISHLRDQPSTALSGGERRRLEITRALATNPRYILLDEPFAGVDPITVLDIQDTIRYLKERNIGVLITDHNVRETLGICDEAYIINDGQILTTGTAAEVIAHPEVRRVYLGQSFNL